MTPVHDRAEAERGSAPVDTGVIDGPGRVTTVATVAAAMLAYGVLTAAVVDVAPSRLGSAMALVHLGLVAGLPAALALGRRGTEAGFFALVFSAGLSGLGAQPLVWTSEWSLQVMLLVVTGLAGLLTVAVLAVSGRDT